MRDISSIKTTSDAIEDRDELVVLGRENLSLECENLGTGFNFQNIS